MRFIDLNSKPRQSHTCASLRKEMADELRKDSILSTDGFFARIRISSLCGALPRQPQSAKFFMLGSVSDDGLRSAHLSRKSQGHRDLFESCGREALPHGHSRQGLSQHAGARQRSARLENLPGLCPGTDPKRQGASSQRSSLGTTRSNRVRFRFHHRRSVPVAISLGEVSKTQSRRQASHPSGLTGQHPHYGDRYYGSGPT